MSQQPLVRSLGFKEAASLVVGSVIGTGVFLKAGIMSQTTGSPTWVLIAWVLAGALSLIGALCYAELGGLFPRAGGEYVYLREAYGELPAFLFGWMRFWIASPGSIAAYGVGAATFLSGVVDLDGTFGRQLTALAFIIFFTATNCLAVSIGGRIQAFVTALKILMILGLTFAIFAFGENASWSNLSVESDGFRGFSAFGTAVLAALWAYDGWNNMPMAAGEIKDPERNVPRALVAGMFLVLIIYGLANLAYFYALPFHEVLSAFSRSTPDALPVATKAAMSAFGAIAVGILSIAFVISALGAMNGSILTGARVPFAMARDGLFFKRLGEVSASRSPVTAVVTQGIVACVLALSGTFDQLTDYVVFAAWIFYALVTSSLFVFRKRSPHPESRPFSTPGYPWLPLIFIVLSILLLINTLITSPKESGIGLCLILAGIPFHYVMKRRKQPS